MENHWYLNHRVHTILAVERHQSKRLVVAKELSLDEEDGLSCPAPKIGHGDAPEDGPMDGCQCCLGQMALCKHL